MAKTQEKNILERVKLKRTIFIRTKNIFKPFFLDIVQSGLVWFGPVPFGLVWFSLIRSDLIWFGPIRSNLVRFSSIGSNPVRFSPIWSGLTWFGSVQSNLIRSNPVLFYPSSPIWLGPVQYEKKQSKRDQNHNNIYL